MKSMRRDNTIPSVTSIKKRYPPLTKIRRDCEGLVEITSG